MEVRRDKILDGFKEEEEVEIMSLVKYCKKFCCKESREIVAEGEYGAKERVFCVYFC